MNENGYNVYEEEMELDLIDLMFYLMRQWKTLILAVLVGALVGGGIYMMKKASFDQAEASSEEEEDEEESLEDYVVDPDVKANMELAYQYRQLYLKQLEYNQKSVVMQLDPNAVYTGELRYYMTAGDDTGLISILYQNILGDKNLLTELQEASQLDCSPSYIQELIGCSINTERDSLININNVMNTPGESASFVEKNSVITYTVVSINEESCRKMLQILQEKVEELNKECEETYEEYEAMEVNNAVRLLTNNEYLNKQRSHIDQLSSYLSNVRGLESSFAEEDRKYYNQMYLARVEEDEDDEESQELLAATEEPAETAPSPVKWVIIGIFLMGVCWGGFYMLKYLLDKHIKTSDEIRSYRLPLIGCLEGHGPVYTGLNKKIEQLRRRTKESADTEDYVAASLDALDVPGILLCGDQKDEDVNQVMASLKEKSAKAELSDYPGQDSDALERAREKGVVFVVHLGHTTRTELKREMEVCRMQKIGVLGAVVI